MSWAGITDGEKLPALWRAGGREPWLCLGGSCLVWARASKMFAAGERSWNFVRCLQHCEAASFRGLQQLSWDLSPRAKRVEVRFKCSWGEQFRKRAVVVRVRKESGPRLRAGRGAVALLAELLSFIINLPENAPFSWSRLGSGKYAVLAQSQYASVRQLVKACEPTNFRCIPQELGAPRNSPGVGYPRTSCKENADGNMASMWCM